MKSPINNMPQGGGININLAECDSLACKCGSELWTPIFIVKRIKSILVGAPKDILQPIQCWKCSVCGEVFNPLNDLPEEEKPVIIQ